MKDRKCFSDQMNRNRSLTLLKQKDIMLNSMTQTGEKWDSLVLGRGDFWMIWTCHAILCFYFIFMFRNVIREQLGQNNFSGCYVFFFKSNIPKVLDHNDVQSSLSTIMKHLDWQRHLKRHLTTEDFMDTGVKPAPIHSTYYCMLLFLSNKPSF